MHILNAKTGQDKEVLHLKFLVYGQAMSTDLNYYVASDWEWNIFSSRGNYLKLLVRNYTGVPGFEGANKLINFTFLDNNKVLASGFGNANANDKEDVSGTFLFDLNTFKPINDYIGNVVQTFATISPDGKYVVAGDMNGGNLFVWDVKSGKQKLHVVANMPVYGYTKEGDIITNKNMPKPPSDFYNHCDIISIKYIDADNYLVFEHQSHHAILYKTLNSTLIKYFDLGTAPWPAIFNLERDQSMDTSPSAHILVMAKDQEPGIMVYHYDPKKQTLEKVWDGN